MEVTPGKALKSSSAHSRQPLRSRARSTKDQLHQGVRIEEMQESRYSLQRDTYLRSTVRYATHLQRNFLAGKIRAPLFHGDSWSKVAICSIGGYQ